jgi:predicted glutamine amidotransferase
MPATNQLHECDLFCLSSHCNYTGDRILPIFARRGAGNIDGWGIGYYTDAEATVVRRERRAANSGSVSEEFAMAVETISSSVILGHLRLASRGATCRQNNHPFHLQFLGYDWLLIHNGSAARAEQLVPPAHRLLRDSDSDTPRVFEFLRDRMVRYCNTPQHSLIEGCRTAYSELLEADPGGFNLILSNGRLTFVFIHWRPLYWLRRTKDTGDVALVSTLRLTNEEPWIEYRPLPGKKAKMLVLNGPTLVLNGDVPR